MPRETTFQGNGMTLAELQEKYRSTREWKLLRVSKRGNRIIFSEHVDGYDSMEGLGGKAFATYVTTSSDRTM